MTLIVYSILPCSFIEIPAYGLHYWMLDIDMDCSGTVNGWFEFKAYISNGPGWEKDISQPETPYSSNNHFAKCGHVNVFRYGENEPVEIKPVE